MVTIVMRNTPDEVIRTVRDAALRRINFPGPDYFGARYRVEYHDHDTGTSLRLQAVLDNEMLLVWDYQFWKSSNYEFNNRDKVLGLQVDGPWAADIDDIVEDLRMACHNHDAEKAQKEREAIRKAETEATERLERFRAHYHIILNQTA